MTRKRITLELDVNDRSTYPARKWDWGRIFQDCYKIGNVEVISEETVVTCPPSGTFCINKVGDKSGYINSCGQFVVVEDSGNTFTAPWHPNVVPANLVPVS